MSKATDGQANDRRARTYRKPDQRHDSAHPAFAKHNWRRRTSAPDPKGGEKYVNISYSCGDYICDGQLRFPYSRLRRFSKRARRELRTAGAACPVGGTIPWTVQCQHYEQDLLLDKIFAWFQKLPNAEPRSDFVHRGYHPAIDPQDEWLPSLNWKELLLLDHTLDYVHPREPLDNKKIRCLIWQLLTLDELEANPLTPGDVYLVWNLLQSKTGWVQEAAIYEGVATPTVSASGQGQNRQVSSSSAMSGLSMSSTLEEEIAEAFNGWETKNSALMRNIIRKAAAYLEKQGNDAFERFIHDLDGLIRGDASSGNSVQLGGLIRKVYEDRNSRPGSRVASGGSVDKAWLKAVGEAGS